MRTVTTPAAREDILAQFRYYALEQGVPDVGFRFLDAVEAAIARIGEMPAIGAPQHFETPALAGARGRCRASRTFVCTTSKPPTCC